MGLLAVVSLTLLLALVGAQSNTPSWVSLPMQGPQGLVMGDITSYSAPILVGTPPQQVNTTVNLSGDLLAIFDEDCDLCAGDTFYDPGDSSTFKDVNLPWGNGGPTFNGSYVNDTTSFGNVVSDSRSSFVLINTMSTNFSERLSNGHLGVFVSPGKGSYSSTFTRMWAQKQLLNPVIGMSFHPNVSRITVGALDTADYDGEINWVEMENADSTWDLPNVVKIDGFKGFNGSLIPWGDNLFAGLNALSSNVVVPNSWTYLADDGYVGPQATIGLTPDTQMFGFQCNDSSMPYPYVHLTATINGVDYPIDSRDNLLHPLSGSGIAVGTGLCAVGISNRTAGAPPPGVELGLPFLRSVYLAYRFPTDDGCPGYYGFAFPKGANRTSSILAQTPKASPTMANQCLKLTAPTSTPTAQFPSKGPQGPSSEKYWVYNRFQDGQVPLVGVNDLPRRVWNASGSGLACPY